MTKVSKILLVLLACASFGFFGLAAVSWSAHQPKIREKVEALKKERQALETERQAWRDKKPAPADLDLKIAEAKKLNPLDAESMNRRADALAKQLAALNAEFVLLSKKYLEKQAETQTVRDEIVRLRQETEQLLAQLESLRAERGAAEKEERRLKDLLVQAEGILERAEIREQQLQADGAEISP